MIRATCVLNRASMLHGVPGLRDLWPLSRVPGVRAIANVRQLDFPAADMERLKAVCGPGRATFITPNHPEFFTDWMIDKEILWRVAPMAASWATHGVVNGTGALMQRFWLANNLIAQIPGNSDPARRHSVAWAAKGHCVLLHPEGAVGWHNDHVAPLMPGAVEMAAQALQLGRQDDPAFRAFVAPIVWKLVFLRDAEDGLRREAAYVERRLGIDPGSAVSSADRVFHIYDALMRREAEARGLAAAGSLSLKQRHAALVGVAGEQLARTVGTTYAGDDADLLRAVRRWLRHHEDADREAARTVKMLSAGFSRLLRLGPFAFESPEITQEQIAEHLKRIRNDYCKGTLRDTTNAFMPQPVAPRRAIVRVPEPIEIASPDIDVEATTKVLRDRLQKALDAINGGLRTSGAFRTASNPFFGS